MAGSGPVDAAERRHAATGRPAPVRLVEHPVSRSPVAGRSTAATLAPQRSSGPAGPSRHRPRARRPSVRPAGATRDGRGRHRRRRRRVGSTTPAATQASTWRRSCVAVQPATVERQRQLGLRLPGPDHLGRGGLGASRADQSARGSLGPGALADHHPGQQAVQSGAGDGHRRRPHRSRPRPAGGSAPGSRCARPSPARRPGHLPGRPVGGRRPPPPARRPSCCVGPGRPGGTPPRAGRRTPRCVVAPGSVTATSCRRTAGSAALLAALLPGPHLQVHRRTGEVELLPQPALDEAEVAGLDLPRGEQDERRRA